MLLQSVSLFIRPSTLDWFRAIREWAIATDYLSRQRADLAHLTLFA